MSNAAAAPADLAKLFPHRRLASLPTALDPAPRLGAAIGAPHLLTKRDDLSATVYGGNKVRKLEYLLGHAVERGCDGVVTFGAAGSNHALATAIYAHSLGLTCHAVLTDQVPTPYVGDTLRWHLLLGTRLVAAADFAGTKAVAAELRARHPGGADRLYEIPWGGSSALGSVGFVAAGLELDDQLTAAGIGGPVRIYLPCGTMGSVAGLLLGLAAARRTATVVAVKVVPQNAVDAAAVQELCRAIHGEVRRRTGDFPDYPAAGPARLEFRAEFVGDGYAVPTPEGVEAVRLAALDGFKVDTTYSGKALACLIADARAGRLAGCTPVFWQTWNSRPYPPEIRLPETGGAELTRSEVANGVPAAFRKFL